MKATTLLRDQHRRIERLLVQAGMDDAARLPLVLELVEELMTHLSIEDHLFLCEIGDTTRIRVEPFRDRQARVRNAVLQVVFVEEDDSRFAPRLRELAAEFTEHVRALERDLLPLVESQIPVDGLESMGDRMHRHWEAALHAGPPPSAHAAQ